VKRQQRSVGPGWAVRYRPGQQQEPASAEPRRPEDPGRAERAPKAYILALILAIRVPIIIEPINAGVT
jgi:hypothetical protein